MSLLLTSLTLLCVLGISVGQLLFKKAAMMLPAQPALTDWIFNGWLIVALALYGVTTLLWIWVLRSAPLHLAYPFMGLAFLIVPALGWLFLKEPLHLQTFIGGALILAGIAVAGRASA
ncbi:EamA family transporter [Acidovorax sp. NCPPB 3576]|uniref:EamA family transporter n=1 Tax=Acidovorax sp. NCPPB 3576 TaxID=2940488 RepID=UPI002349A5CF|nr:EamA family transporter [Acidovorax sp. NCPPB 3576]WCM89214.1 EamA family transporter [Acidovorax sp. NCPPB 3576]